MDGIEEDVQQSIQDRIPVSINTFLRSEINLILTELVIAQSSLSFDTQTIADIMMGLSCILVFS